MWPSLRRFYLVKCPKFATISHKTFREVGKQCDHSSTKELGALVMPSSQTINKTALIQSPSLQYLEKVVVYNCNNSKCIFSTYTARGLPHLKVLIIESCDKVEKFFENHDTQSFVSMLPRLRSVTINNCNLLEYIFHASFGRGLVELREIIIRKTPQLRYVFCHNIQDEIQSSHQDQSKIKIELPSLEKVVLKSIPNMIDMSPSNYFVACSSLIRLFMDNVVFSTLPIDNLRVDPGATHPDHISAMDTTMTSITNIVQIFGTIAIENSDKIEGIFHQEGFPINGQQVTLWLEDLKFLNLPKLGYIWKSAKNFVSLQHLYKLHICNCPKLKVISSASISRVLPVLKILVVKHCEELEQIIEDDGENGNITNPQSPKVCFSRLKLLLVTHCNKLKCLFYTSTSHEFPELEYLIVNHDSCLMQVFEGEPSVKEGMVHVFLPKLRHIILMHLPNLNNIYQGIDFETTIVHSCPKLLLSSSITVEDMLKISTPDEEIDSIVRSELSYMRHIIIEEATDKSLMPKFTSRFQMSPQDLAASKNELPPSQVNGINQCMSSNLVGPIHEHKHFESRTTQPHEFLTLERKDKGTRYLQSLERKSSLISSLNLIKLVDQESSSEISFLDQQHALGETTVIADLAQDIEEALKGRIYERATLQEDVKTTLSPTIDEGIDLDVVANNANSSGGNMHVRVSQVIDQDASGSNSLILEEFKLFKPFVKLDDAQIVVLMEAIDVYPHLWKVCKKFSARFQAWMLKTLADMLLFLRNESAISVTHEKEKKFHTLCDEAIQLGFEKSWVNEMRQRVIRRGLEVEHAKIQLNELLNRQDQLAQELHEIKNKINNYKDFFNSQKKCFDFL